MIVEGAYLVHIYCMEITWDGTHSVYCKVQEGIPCMFRIALLAENHPIGMCCVICLGTRGGGLLCVYSEILCEISDENFL